MNTLPENRKNVTKMPELVEDLLGKVKTLICNRQCKLILKQLDQFYFCSVVFCQNQTDVCQEGVYKILAGDRRSAGYENVIGDTPLCDRFNTIQSGKFSSLLFYMRVNFAASCIPRNSLGI